MNILNDHPETRGRRKLTEEERQVIVDTWHKLSVVTVDRRNNRDVVKIRRSEFLQHQNLKRPADILIEHYTSKRSQEMVKSTCYISTKTVCEFQNIIQSKCGFHVSIGTVLSLRPFYIVPPTEHEKESCLCKFCLNLCLKFTELQ